MKKTFYEKPTVYLTFIVFLGFLYAVYASVYVFVLEIMMKSMLRCILAVVFLFVIILFERRIIVVGVLDNMHYLTVTDHYIERHCLFRKKQRICYDNPDCRIGVDIIPPHPRYATKDETRAWIYISTESYPEDKRGQIVKVKNTQNFIKFVYSKKLAETILNVAPKEKCKELNDFYVNIEKMN